MIPYLKRFLFRAFITAASLIAVATLLTGCNSDDPEPDPPYYPPGASDKVSTSILLYAVASNNLASNFIDDRREIARGLADADLDEVDFYIYSVLPTIVGDTPIATLEKACRRKDNNSVEFVEVAVYDRETYSTDPERIAQVISDYQQLSPADSHGIIFWSHATSWSPAFSDHNVAASRSASSEIGDVAASRSAEPGLGEAEPFDTPALQWFGQDTFNGKSDYCDIVEMADAIPDNYFDFIWWDCCYMSSIEVIYQFRRKAPMFVAYPTEVLAEGAPYDIIVPYLARADYNLVMAADVMADYFNSGEKIFTIAVVDPSALEEIADMASLAMTGTRPSQIRLLKYSRGSLRLYDFGDYMSNYAQPLGDAWDQAAFDRAMNRLVIYKASSSKLFTGKEIPSDSFYGISAQYFDLEPDFDPEPEDVYYMNLDWYKRVF
ncbi:MAG: hypothetical protein K2L83_02685 [Muribaculaceae bacterium]|nr:hypothetical protein [Muribaculaceae bacterium]